MKTRFFFLCLLLVSGVSFGQIEIPRTTNTGGLLKADNSKENKTTFPSLKIKKEDNSESKFLRKEPKKIDFRETNDDLLTAGSLVEKKWKKDKAAQSSVKENQYLGDFKTSGKYVELYCRDHEFVDGDHVKISVNGKVIEPNLGLGGGYTPLLVTLEPGLNTIEFEALNQGSSGPNTAELKVYDDLGKSITRKEWNLLTGAKASLIVVKK